MIWIKHCRLACTARLRQLIRVNLQLTGYGLLRPYPLRLPLVVPMFFDEVVLAGVLIVGLCLVFFAGFAAFIWKDSHKRKNQEKSK